MLHSMQVLIILMAMYTYVSTCLLLLVIGSCLLHTYGYHVIYQETLIGLLKKIRIHMWL